MIKGWERAAQSLRTYSRLRHTLAEQFTDTTTTAHEEGIYAGKEPGAKLTKDHYRLTNNQYYMLTEGLTWALISSMCKRKRVGLLTVWAKMGKFH